MLGLVDAQGATAWKAHADQRAPALLIDGRALYAGSSHLDDEVANVVTHEEELMATTLLVGVQGKFCRR